MDNIKPRTAADGEEHGADWIEGDDEIVTVGGPLPHVVHVEAAGALTLFVRFDDGVEGKVKFNESALRGVFEKLRDPDYFRRVGILYGAVSWPNEDPDLAPCTMHHELAAHGEWILN